MHNLIVNEKLLEEPELKEKWDIKCPEFPRKIFYYKKREFKNIGYLIKAKHVSKFLYKPSFLSFYSPENKPKKCYIAVKSIDEKKAKNVLSETKSLMMLEEKKINEQREINIIRLYGFKRENGCYLLYMEWMDFSLKDLYEMETKGIKDMLLNRTLNNELKNKLNTLIGYIMVEIIDALCLLVSCEKPIIHRDVKPENILLNYKGSVKLADFGEARFENTKTIGGTPRYRPPEAFKTVDVDENDLQKYDVFSLGIVVLEYFCGMHPFYYIKKPISGYLDPIEEAELAEEGELIKWAEENSAFTKLINDDNFRTLLSLSLQPIEHRATPLELQQTSFYRVYKKENGNPQTGVATILNELQIYPEPNIITRESYKKRIYCLILFNLICLILIVLIMIYFTKIMNEGISQKQSTKIYFTKTMEKEQQNLCDDGWSYMEQTRSCYKLVEECLTWLDAQTKCEELNANLASIHTKKENDFINDVYNRSGRIGCGYYYAYIGFKRSSWSDGTNVNYTNWAPMHSSYFNPKKCGIISINFANWHTDSCYSELNFICKKELYTSQKQSTKIYFTKTMENKQQNLCDDEWSYFEQTRSCYKLAEECLTWLDAQTKCEELNANLASIHTKEENDFIDDVYNRPGRIGCGYYYAYIGFKNYSWSDGTNVNYTNWAPVHNSSFNPKRCVSISISRGDWHTDNCYAEYNFICKKKLDIYFTKTMEKEQQNLKEHQDIYFTKTMEMEQQNLCDDGWSYYEQTRSCYKLAEECLTWLDAQTKCEELNANLASIHTKKENDFIDDVYNRPGRIGCGYHYAYIGLKNSSWSDGTNVNYTNWAPVHSSSFNPKQCSSISISRATWYTDSCYAKYNFICKKELYISQKQSTNIYFTKTMEKEQQNRCDNGWSYLEQTRSCYKLVEECLAWLDAQTKCEELNANLTSIHTKKENDFIDDVYNRPGKIGCGYHYAYIGFKNYSWSDGTNVNYTNWAPVHSSYFNPKKCGIISISKADWHTDDCYAEYNFICKKKLYLL